MHGNRLLKAIKRCYWSVRFEAHCLLCSLLGVIKVRLFFKRSATNKLEIGIGDTRAKPGFISTDLSFKTDFPFDLRLGLPFFDRSIDFIYAEHVLEHFSYEDLVVLLRDCYRVLKSKGVLSVVVPDASIYAAGYFKAKDFDRRKYCQYDFGLPYKSPMDYLNYIFYMGGHHRYMFDQAGLIALLSDTGFCDVRIRSFDATLDKPEREYESIYVMCSK